jgi:hypothetical protein
MAVIMTNPFSEPNPRQTVDVVNGAHNHHAYTWNYLAIVTDIVGYVKFAYACKTCGSD